MVPVLIIGELNVDLILSGSGRLPTFGAQITVDDFAVTLGSASAICAVGFARLAHPVPFAGKVGFDPWGDYCVDALRPAGVCVESIVRDAAAKTGVTVSLERARANDWAERDGARRPGSDVARGRPSSTRGLGGIAAQPTGAELASCLEARW